jgi:chromosome segregation ATPase
MDEVLERLEALEHRVRESLAELQETRRGRDALAKEIQGLQAELRTREQEFVALLAARERDAAEITRLRAEREEVRGRVEGLLAEIARLEATMQGVGT